MAIKKVLPDAPGVTSGTLTYACRTCGTETVRRHKGPELLKANEAERGQHWGSSRA